jgi:hypothetical protein
MRVGRPGLQRACRSHVTVHSFLKFRVVGRGAFGTVWSRSLAGPCALRLALRQVSFVSKTDTGASYAMKEMNKQQIKHGEMYHVVVRAYARRASGATAAKARRRGPQLNEVNILSAISQPNEGDNP